MSFHDLINSLTTDTKDSLLLFLPELTLCATIVLMLLARIFNLSFLLSGFRLALVGSAIALAFAMPGVLVEAASGRTEIFTGMLVYDSFTVFFRCVLLLFALLLCILTWISGIPDREDAPDFYTLVLGATLGMCLMVSANHMLSVFLAVEMASVPSYVLVGLLKGRRQSSEAALKYAIYGAGAAGVMLYGISLMTGILGTAHLPTMAQQLVAMDLPKVIAEGGGGHTLFVLVLGALMVMVGLAFKLSAVPFHFWCPDVFEGAAAEVNAFLSVASKAAALALLVRVSLGLGFLAPVDTQLAAEAPPATVAAHSLFNVAQDTTEDSPETSAGEKSAAGDSAAEPAEEKEADSSATPTTGNNTENKPADSKTPEEAGSDSNQEATFTNFSADLVRESPQIAALRPVRGFAVKLLAFIAAITCTFGNLAAYGQKNIKRLLAYSTIAHAGYMIMAVAATLAAVDLNPESLPQTIGALTFYISVYLFMNLGAFAIIAFLRNAYGTEQISDYAGLVRSCPGVVVCFCLILFSLIGLPPLAGFAGKFAIFMALVDVGGPVMMGLLVIAGINTVISLVYYIRVAKVLTIDSEPDSRVPASLGFFATIYTAAITLPVVVLGIWFDEVYAYAEQASRTLFL